MAFIGPVPHRLVARRPVSPPVRSYVCNARLGVPTPPLSRRSVLTQSAAAAFFALAEGSLAGRAVAAEPAVSIEDVVVGSGAVPTAGATIKVHYTLTLNGFEGENGSKVVDSSRSRRKPFRYQYMGGQVIKGWEMGVEGMKVGSRRRIVVPPELGYGSRGAGNGLIPGGSNLYFDIELLGINS